MLLDTLVTIVWSKLADLSQEKWHSWILYTIFDSLLKIGVIHSIFKRLFAIFLLRFIWWSCIFMQWTILRYLIPLCDITIISWTVWCPQDRFRADFTHIFIEKISKSAQISNFLTNFMRTESELYNARRVKHQSFTTHVESKS